MSFSKDIKSEIAKSKINKNLIKYELFGFVISNSNIISNNILRFSTENIDILERYKYIIKILCNIDIQEEKYEQINKAILYVFYISNIEDFIKALDFIKINVNDIVIKNYKLINELIKVENEAKNQAKNQAQNEAENKKTAFLKGVFLGSGYVSNPKESYHLEIINQNINIAKNINNIINEFDIISSVIKRKKQYVIYIKDAESIVTFIILLGANVGVLKIEQTRVEKEINNNINRLINCETANLNKSLLTSKKQIEGINYIKQIGKYNLLNDSLKVVCEKRLENPELNLIELANIIGISKSGLNNRFRKINEIVNEYRNKGE